MQRWLEGFSLLRIGKLTMELPEDLFKILIRIESRLSKIEGKQNELCENTKRVNRRLERAEDMVTELPCEQHTKAMLNEMNKRVTWSQFWSIILVFIAIMISAFTYTAHVDDDLKAHELKIKAHQFR